MLYMCIEYHILVNMCHRPDIIAPVDWARNTNLLTNMYHVSAQGVDERMINYIIYISTNCLWGI